MLADDHAILRDGLRSLLAVEPDIDVVGEAGDGAELLALLATTPADVVLMDVNMPVLDGFGTMAELQQRLPNVKVLVLSMLDNEQYVVRMLQAGALGYVLKNAAFQEITHAIRTVARGQRFLCTEIGLNMLYKAAGGTTGGAVTAGGTARGAATAVAAAGGAAAAVAADGSEPGEPAESATVGLTARELEVLKLIAEGFTNGEVADKLFTSKRTIETHRQNIISKTGVKNTAALIKLAVRQGLIN